MDIGSVLAFSVLASFLLNGVHRLSHSGSRFFYFPPSGWLSSALTAWGSVSAILAALSLLGIVPMMLFLLVLTAYVVALQLYAIHSRRRRVIG